jgi:hypothetical protein
MIERPASRKASVTPAGDARTEADQAALAPPGSAPPAAERTPTVLAGMGPDPALAPPAPPRLTDSTRTRFGHERPRSAARSTRTVAGMEGMEYRAVFACCSEATDTPTE